MSTRTKEAVTLGPAAGNVDRPSSNCVSSRNRLEQAASLLLLLQRPLDTPEQRRLWRLFNRRLRQAYAGGVAVNASGHVPGAIG